MRIRNSEFRTQNSGQALVETALIVPFLLMIALNVVNFGYFFLMAVNLAAAPRSGALYTILGDATPASVSASFPGLPPAISDKNCPASTTTCDVSDLTYADLTGAVYSPTSNGDVNVCSQTVGITGTGTSQASTCTSTGTATGYSFPASAPADPEQNSAGTAPMFFAGQVDVAYKFTPLIPGTPFNIILLASPICTSSGGVTCTFHRAAVMREMN